MPSNNKTPHGPRGGGDARAELAARGIHLRHHHPGEHRAACPACAQTKARRGDDALAVRIDPDGGATWFCHRCGDKGSTRTTARNPSAPVMPRPTPKPQPASAKARRAALAFWARCQEIKADTPAGRYLAARGCPLPGPGADLRWHSALHHPSGHVGPALVALVTDAVTAEPMTLHQTWLAPDGRGKAAIDKPRRLWLGLPKRGGIIRLGGSEHGPLLIAEGVETALTGVRAGYRAIACIDKGNLEKLAPLEGEAEVLIVADHDTNGGGMRAAETCAAVWHAGSRTARIWCSSDIGHDLNDEAHRRTDDELRAMLDAAPPWVPPIAGDEAQAPSLPPYFKPGELPAGEAHGHLRAEVEAFVAAAVQRHDGEPVGPPPQVGIAATVGLGKSTITLDVLAAIATGKTVWYFVPTLTLADELAAKAQGLPAGPNAEELAKEAQALGIPTEVLRGRDRENPAQPNTRMCAKADLATKLARAGHSVFAALCHLEREDGTIERCEFFDGCPYVGQFQRLEGRLIILAHNWLTLPEERLPAPAMVIIDERFLSVLLRDTSLPLERIGAPRPPVRKILRATGIENGKQHLSLERAEDRMRAVMADHLDRCRVVREALTAGVPVRLSVDELQTMARIEHALAEGSPVTPGQDYRTQKARIAMMREQEAWKRARLFRLLAEDAARPGGSQRVVVRRDVASRGELQDRVFLYDRKELRLPAAPLLALDADLDERIAHKLLPDLRIVSIRAQQQAEVIQVINTPCSREKLSPRTNARAAEHTRAANRRREIEALAAVEARNGKRVLIVGNKPVVELMQVPTNCDKAHFGALRGLDGYKDYDTIIVAGREQPTPDDMENKARSLFGDDPEPLLLLGDYVKQTRAYAMRDGSCRTATVQAHPDPRVQALLEQSREHEIVQAVGRLRLVHRDPARPARVLLLSNLPTALLLDRLVTWDEIMPDRLSQAIVRGQGVLPLSAAELARVHPDLWRSREAAKKDIQRSTAPEKGGHSPIRNLYWGLSPLSAATEVAYRRPGQARGSPHRAILPGVVEDQAHAEDLLIGVLGEVEQVRLVATFHRPGAQPVATQAPPMPEAHPPPPSAGVIEDPGEPPPPLVPTSRLHRTPIITDAFAIDDALIEVSGDGAMTMITLTRRPPFPSPPFAAPPWGLEAGTWL